MAEIGSGYNPTQTYVNSKGLKLDNLVYMAGNDGKNIVGSEDSFGVQHNDKDVFVKSPNDQLGIYHPNMMKQWQAQYKKESTGNAVVDQANKDINFACYVTDQYAKKADEVFNLLGNMKNTDPEKDKQIKTKLAQIEDEINNNKNLSEQEKKEQKSILSFKAVADMTKGTELGNKASEAYALSNYNRDIGNYVGAQYGLSTPGQKNPYNQQGQTYYNSANQVQDPAIQKQIQQQQIMQFLTLLSLMSACRMGNFGMMFAPWMSSRG